LCRAVRVGTGGQSEADAGEEFCEKLLAFGSWLLAFGLNHILREACDEELQGLARLGGSPPVNAFRLQGHADVSEGRTVWADQSDSTGICFDSRELGGRMRQTIRRGDGTIRPDCDRIRC